MTKDLTEQLREELVSFGQQEWERHHGVSGRAWSVHRRSELERHGTVSVKRWSHRIQSGSTERQCWCKAPSPLPSFYTVLDPGSSPLKLFEMALTDMLRGVSLN